MSSLASTSQQNNNNNNENQPGPSTSAMPEIPAKSAAPQNLAADPQQKGITPNKPSAPANVTAEKNEFDKYWEDPIMTEDEKEMLCRAPKRKSRGGEPKYSVPRHLAPARLADRIASRCLSNERVL